MASFKSFEDLDCWKSARALRLELSLVIKGFPKDEKFELTSQVRRATRSVTNNIAEGFGRYHYQEFIQFCRVARGSLAELIDHLIIAKDGGYIEDERLENLKAKIERTMAMINGLIRYLAKQKREDR